MTSQTLPLRTQAIRTKRLTLRPTRLLDAKDFHQILTSDRAVVSKTGTWEIGASLTNVKKRMQLHASPMSGKHLHDLAIERNGQLVGEVTISARQNGFFLLGYWIARSFWRKGYATEAAKAAVKHTFETLNARAFVACASFDNHGSNAILRKLGFVETHRAKVFTPGRSYRHTLIFYMLTREQYFRRYLKIIHTERFVLRPPETDDTGRLCQLLDDYETSQTLGSVPHPYAEKDAHQFITNARTRKKTWEAVFAIADDNDELIGAVGITNRAQGPTLGYWVGKSYWGQGIMSEAAQTAVDWYFEGKNPGYLTCGAMDTNKASLRIQEKIGFQEVGRSKVKSLAQGTELPHVDTKLTREEYWARRQSQEK